MGGGSYSSVARKSRLEEDYDGLDLKSASDAVLAKKVFTRKSVNNAMDPCDVEIRESRDSEEHPNSLAIIIALDLTGSMGSIPNHLVRKGLPDIMETIIGKGIKDPQVLFLGVGDHECDTSPLQVGQFESSDELLDHWLTNVYLEGGGGGNGGESYLLAWYFAGNHTSIDCFEKRKQKGYLFTIGDEPTLESISKRDIQGIMGKGQFEDFTALQLLDKARETYNVYHLHIKEGCNGRKQFVMDGWKQIMGDNLIIVDNHKDVSKVISEIVTTHAVQSNVGVSPTVSFETSETSESKEEAVEEML